MNNQDKTFAPIIILVCPQLAENIGAVARAMLNNGLTQLRLVSPRDGWPNQEAYPMAAGADAVLDQVRLFDSVAQAIQDCHIVFATSARPRDLAKESLNMKQAAIESHAALAKGQKIAILFGAERSGLSNADMALANKFISVPLNPDFKSLNLAQSVLLYAYEYFQRQYKSDSFAMSDHEDLASKADIENYLKRLIEALDETHFFSTQEQKPAMVTNLKNLFHRFDLTEQEVRSLHGVLSALSIKK